MPQQALGREQDERFAVGAHHLAAQDVEDLCWGGGLDYLEVVVRG